MTFMVVGSFLLEVNMNKYEIAKLKKDLLKKKSHDIFKNVQDIFGIRIIKPHSCAVLFYTFISPNVKSSSPIKSVNIE